MKKWIITLNLSLKITNGGNFVPSAAIVNNTDILEENIAIAGVPAKKITHL